MRLRYFAVLAFAALCGCNSQPFAVAQVSGRVTLDGKPLPKASITFVPLATKENLAPGPTATALTDADGRYTLTVNKDTPGAVVGRCRIFVTTMFTDAPPPDRDGGPPVRMPKDKVPERYNVRTDLTYDVPRDGTDHADFDLKSR
jgi:hypothetical protein